MSGEYHHDLRKHDHHHVVFMFLRGQFHCGHTEYLQSFGLDVFHHDDWWVVVDVQQLL